MKVLFTHFTADIFGGSDKSLFELISSLDRSIITPVLILKVNDPLITKYINMGIKVYQIYLEAPPKKILSIRAIKFLLTFIPSVLSIMYIIKREDIKVGHVNTSLNIQGGLAIYLSKVPLAWHIREIFEEGTLSNLVKQTVCKLATVNIAISNAVKQNYNCSNTTVIYNGMNLDKYKDLSMHKNKKNIKITCVGRFEEWKGQHVLLESMMQLLSNFSNIELDFVGGPAKNKPEYFEELQQEVKRLSLEDKIHFLGLRDDIPKLLSETDILVAPTTTAEPFGRTIIEGMAASCIVVSTKAGGPLEIITDSIDGFLVEPNSVSDLTRKLLDIIRDIDTYEELRQNAKITAFNKYNITRVSKEVETVLCNIK